MAYLYSRAGGRVEIREAHTTPRGPRSRTLASFRGALSDAHLDRAEAAARRPFDRTALVRRARERGVPVEQRRADGPARALLAALRRGAPLDPRLRVLLRDQLGGQVPPLAEDLGDVVDWLGASDVERGLALRDVLRLYDTIARSREPVRAAEPARFPRIQTAGEERSAG